MLPIIGIGDTLQYMTGRPGIRYKKRVGTLTGDAQFAPYNPQRAVDYNLGIAFRDLETHFGSVVANFDLTRLSQRFSAQARPRATVR